MRDTLAIISRIVDTRGIDQDAERWLVDSLRGWWLGGSDPARLAAYLHIPTGSRYDVSERNRWLRLAASELPAERRGADLHKCIAAFMRQRWPLWRGMSTPPECDEIESALFYAAASGASMRIKRRQVNNIINEQ